MLPPKTKGLLYHDGLDRMLPGNDEIICEGAKFHSPRPLLVTDERLLLADWGEAERLWDISPRAWLCGTCRVNLSILLSLLHHTDGDLPWEIRREFGNDLRALAQKGWDFYSSRRPAPQVTSGH